MNKKYHLYLIIGIIILIVPTVVYLCFLLPKMKEEYITLMSSGGVIAGGGMYGASLIPEKVKFSGLYKLSARSFTLLTVTVLVERFILQIVGLVCVFIISFIIFSILKEIWKDAKRKSENKELSREIARSLVEIAK